MNLLGLLKDKGLVLYWIFNKLCKGRGADKYRGRGYGGTYTSCILNLYFVFCILCKGRAADKYRGRRYGGTYTSSEIQVEKLTWIQIIAFDYK